MTPDKSAWNRFLRLLASGTSNRPAPRRVRLDLLACEERVTPATAAVSGAESLLHPNVIVVLPTAHTSPVTVKYALGGGTATNNKDFTLTPGTLTFAPGERVKNIPLSVISDGLAEKDETVLIKLTAPKNAQLGSFPTLSYTIVDDDAKPSLSFASATSAVSEGSPDTLNVSLSSASGEPVTVRYAVTGGTASGGADFTPLTGTLTFAPGQISRTVTLKTLKDTKDEADKSAVVTLSEPAGATLGSATSHTVTIRDLNAAPTVAFAASATASAEGAGTAPLRVKLSAASGLPVTVQYAVTGETGVAGTDYDLAAGTLTFAPGETAKDIPVTLIDDNAVETGVVKTVQVTLSAPTNAILGKLAANTLSVNDDDPNVSFAVASSSGSESVAQQTVRVTLSAAATKPVTVGYTVAGTATPIKDHTLAAGKITFAPGETFQDIVVPVVSDTLPEADETLVITLAKPTNAVLGRHAKHTHTIVDDDAKPTVSFASSASSVPEGSPDTLSVSLSSASGEPVTVRYSVTGGTASRGADFTPLTGTLTFTPGQTSRTITLKTLKDAKDEADESAVVSLSEPSGATLGVTTSHAVTIRDLNAPPTVAFTTSATSSAEGAGTAPLRVKLSASSGLPVTVHYAVTGGTGVAGTDYELAAGTLTFAPGETAKDIPVTLIDDNAVEAGVVKTVQVTLSAPTNAALGKLATNTLSVKDDDPNVAFDPLGARSPLPDLMAASDSGKSATDNVTNDATPTIRVAARPGNLVRIFVDGVKVRDVTAEGDVDYTSPALADGTHTVTATVNDLLGNLGSGAAPLAITVDTVAPPVPQVDLAATSDTGAPGDQTTAAGRVTLRGQTEANIDLNVAGGPLTALSSNTGTFQIPHVTLNLGSNVFTVQAADLAGNTSEVTRTITRVAGDGQPDVSIRWNQAALNAITADASAPPTASRALAMVSAAVFDTASALDGTPGFYVSLSAAGASADAAVTEAAYRTLNYLFPYQQANFDALRAGILDGIPESPAKTDGLALGQAVADAIIALRANDGWNDYVDYAPAGGAGEWDLTAPGYAEALLPQWADLTPFAMQSPDQFLAAAPPALDSQEYADALNQVKSLGSVSGSTRTADQTEIARFWADGAGTYTPAGHWNSIATQIAVAEGASLTENARLLAELNVAMGDAAISAWNTKFDYNFWRPVTAIREADTDGNPVTTPDAAWLPLVITPPFPSYVSGHSTYSGAAAAILDATYGTSYAFTTGSPGLAGVTRSFASFDAAEDEAGISRIYGGIHYSFDNEAGKAAGRAIGEYVLGAFATAVDTQAPKVLLAAEAQTASANISVTGRVLDNLSGVATLSVQIDNGVITPVTFDSLGHFSVTTAFALDGSADGAHVLTFLASDALGNASDAPPVTFTLDTRGPAITLTSPAAGPIGAGARLTGQADAAGSPLTRLTYQLDAGPEIPVIFDTAAGTFDLPLDLSPLSINSHTLTVRTADAAGNTATLTRAVTLAALVPLTVASVEPADGAGDVGLTFRPKVTFSRPVNPATLTAANFYASDASGARIPASIVRAADGSFAWLFFVDPLPGASTVTVTVNGATILGTDDAPLNAGGTVATQFVTVGHSPVPGTTITGILADPGADLNPFTYDDVRGGPDLTLMTADDVYLTTITHGKVYVFGHENEAVFTDAAGRFTLANVPAGDVKLVIDGRTATNAPSGFFFPEMVMDMVVRPGIANTVMGGMGTIEQQNAMAVVPGVHLPRLRNSILKPVAAAGTTRVAADADATPGLTPQQRALLYLDVPGGSAIGYDVQPMTNVQVGISAVPAALVRDMLPAGVLQHSFDITIQAPGVAVFTTPVAISMPNMFGLAPGEKVPLLSFDHTTGRLVFDGTMTVSADGQAVASDPGSGVTHPGWHGAPPPGTPTHGHPADPPTDPTSHPDTDQDGPPQYDPITLNGLDSAGGGAGAGALSRLGVNGRYPDQQSTTSGLLDINVLGAYEAVVFDPNAIISTLRFRNAFAFVRDYFSPAGQAAGIEALAGAAAEIVATESSITADRDRIRLLAATDPVDPSRRFAAVLIASRIDDNLADLVVAAKAQRPALERMAVIAAQLGNLLAIADANRPRLGLTTQQISDYLILSAEYKNKAAGIGNTARQVSDNLSLSVESKNKAAGIGNLFANFAAPLRQDTAALVGLYTVPRAASAKSGPLYWSADVGGRILRGKATSPDDINFYSPPDRVVRVTMYDPAKKLIGSVISRVGPAGADSDVGNVPLLPDNGADTDGDGLSDAAEAVLGTNAAKFSTLGDGVSDGAKLVQGIDPKAAFPLPTGLVANLPLAGDSKAVALAGTANAAGLTAYVATGPAGLAVVNVADFTRPVLLGSVTLPGDSADVAVAENLRLAAVAAGPAGLHIVDVSDPTRPSVARTVGANVAAVRVADGIAYAAAGSVIQAFDMLTGDLLQALNLGGAPVRSLALAGDFLYAVGADGALKVIDLAGPQMIRRGGLTLPAGGGAVFVTGGVAYIGVGGDGDNQGYSTVNVENPDALVLLSGPDTPSVGGAAVVPTGSGLVVAVGDPRSGAPLFSRVAALDVLDSGDVTDTGAFVTRYPLPAVPRAVAVGGGAAFVADGAGGLQIAVFAPFDGAGVPPAISLALPAGADTDPATAGIQAAEGTRLRLTATASDDVQVRAVELLVNGEVVRTSVALPYNLAVTLPTRARNGSDTLTLQVRATDTGGNVALSAPIIVRLVPVTAPPPTVLAVNVEDGAVRGPTFRAVTMDFSRVMDRSTLTADTITLTGPAGTVTPVNIQFRRDGMNVQVTYPPLAIGAYRLTLDTTAIKDTTGRAVGGPAVTRDFSLSLYDNYWVTDGGGFWDDGANWATGAPPDADDRVLIDVPDQTATITVRSGDQTAGNLVSNEALFITGGSLAAATIQVNADFKLRGGTIKNSMLRKGTGGQGLTITDKANGGVGGTLDGVTAQGDIRVGVAEETGTAVVKNGLTLDHAVVRLGSPSGNGHGNLQFDPGTAGDSTALAGIGDVVFSRSRSNGIILFAGGGTGSLTIGSGITVRGSAGQLYSNTSGLIVNEGTIRADHSVAPGDFGYDRDFTAGFRPSRFTTTVHSINTTGVANAAPEVVYQSARYDTSFLTYTLRGLAPLAAGKVRLHFADLLDFFPGSSAFDVSLNGVPTLTGFDVFAIAGGAYKAVVRDFPVVADADGNVVVTFTLAMGNYIQVSGLELLDNTGAAVRTVDAGVAPAENPFGGGFVGFNVSGFKNQGVMEARDGGALTTGARWTNEATGTVSAVNATLNFSERFNFNTQTPWSNAGAITAENSTVNFGGMFTGPGDFSQTNSTVNLTGTLDITGRTLTLDAATGSWNFVGGQIFGGTLASADGSALRLTASGGYLYGLTTSADIDARSDINGAFANVFDGLTLNGAKILLGDPYGETFGDRYGQLEFVGPQTLGGTGEVVFGRFDFNRLKVTGIQGNPGQLTIGAGVTLRGAAGVIGGAGAVVINNGTIAADNSVATGDFAYDRSFDGGTVQRITRPIDMAGAAAPVGVYKTVRYSATDFGYMITGLSPGSYTVRLHFADLRNTGTGQGVFDVAIIGMTALDDFDIFAAAGARDTAIVRDTATTVGGDGKLAVDFVAGVGEIQVNGIEVFDNAGTVVWSADAGNVPTDGLTVNGALTNHGTVKAASGGTLNVTNFRPNAGAVAAGAGGLISIGGAFTQTAAGVVNIEIGGPTAAEYGRVTVGGTATLAGTLNLTLAEGYAPAAGVFPVMTWDTVTGTFDAVSGTDIGNGHMLVLAYNTQDLTLDVT